MIQINDCFRIRLVDHNSAHASYQSWQLETRQTSISPITGEACIGRWTSVTKPAKPVELLKFLEDTHCPRSAIEAFITEAGIDQAEAREIERQFRKAKPYVFT